jgi:hypothetical protein
MSKTEYRFRVDRMDDDNHSEVQYYDVYTLLAKNFDTAKTESIRRFSIEHGVHKSKCRSTQISNNEESHQSPISPSSSPVQGTLW